MQAILKQISSVDGVIGSNLFNERGKVLAHACPPLLDVTYLEQAASAILDTIDGLQIAQSVQSMELRYAEGRILIRKLKGAYLCVPCSKNVNLSMVNITLNLAMKKLEAMIPAAVPITSASSDSVHSTASLSSEGMPLRIARLKKGDASSSFDQLGMVAVSQSTAKHISDFFGKSAKKIKVSTSSGGGGTFPVMVINDLELLYEGALVVGPGTEKKLKAGEGDTVTISIA